MNDDVTVRVCSHPRYLSLIRDVTARFCSICGLHAELTGNLKLAVDEACSNVIKHAYHGDTSGRIVVKYSASGKDIRITVEDAGEKARPELMKGRDLDDVKPGGLGLHFIKRVFDVVAYDPKRKKGNRLLLIKHTGSTHDD